MSECSKKNLVRNPLTGNCVSLCKNKTQKRDKKFRCKVNEDEIHYPYNEKNMAVVPHKSSLAKSSSIKSAKPTLFEKFKYIFIKHPNSINLTSKYSFTKKHSNTTTTKSSDGIFDKIKYKKEYLLFSEKFTGIEKILRIFNWLSLPKKERNKEDIEGVTHFKPDSPKFLSLWFSFFDQEKNTELYINKIITLNKCMSKVYNILYRKYVDKKWKNIALPFVDECI